MHVCGPVSLLARVVAVACVPTAVEDSLFTTVSTLKHNEQHNVRRLCLSAICIVTMHTTKIILFSLLGFYSILFYPITLGGRRGTTDEFATIPFHLDLFSAALVELAKSIPFSFSFHCAL